jgi:hypothetical protein
LLRLSLGAGLALHWNRKLGEQRDRTDEQHHSYHCNHTSQTPSNGHDTSLLKIVPYTIANRRYHEATKNHEDPILVQKDPS